jgi:hypothetical protein
MDLLGDLGQMEARFGPFGNCVNLALDRCLDWDEHAMAWNSFWVYPMELLGNMGQMEARFGLFGDCVNLDARLVHDLRQTYHTLRNQFGHTWLYTYMIWVK